MFGSDAANSAKVSSYTDTDGDGYTDALDADVGNDTVMENGAGALLRTGADGNNDGRTDSWPYKNMDGDNPNPYDPDSDGDGITDVKEAQLTDSDWNGQVDGAVNVKWQSPAWAALGSLAIPDSDATGRTDPYDIDADNDGIPDNVEDSPRRVISLSAAADTDGDGIDSNSYDNYAGFGGDAYSPGRYGWGHKPLIDLDNDTDGDGPIDIIEGNDLNLNGIVDDLSP